MENFLNSRFKMTLPILEKGATSPDSVRSSIDIIVCIVFDRSFFIIYLGKTIRLMVVSMSTTEL